jgi:hypothetical protein
MISATTIAGLLMLRTNEVLRPAGAARVPGEPTHQSRRLITPERGAAKRKRCSATLLDDLS